MAKNNYRKGADFERKVIKDLLAMGAALVMRGAGSKSYSTIGIKADIIALFRIPRNVAVIIQCKHTKNKEAAEQEEFMAIGDSDYAPRAIYSWIDAEHYKETLANLKKVL